MLHRKAFYEIGGIPSRSPWVLNPFSGGSNPNPNAVIIMVLGPHLYSSI